MNLNVPVEKTSNKFSKQDGNSDIEEIINVKVSLDAENIRDEIKTPAEHKSKTIRKRKIPHTIKLGLIPGKENS